MVRWRSATGAVLSQTHSLTDAAHALHTAKRLICHIALCCPAVHVIH